MINEKIRTLRLAKHLTQKDMSKALNISQNAYSALEMGRSKMDHERLKKIAVILEIDLYDILNENQPESKTKRTEESNEFSNYLKEVIIEKDKQLEKLIQQNQLLIKQRNNKNKK